MFFSSGLQEVFVQLMLACTTYSVHRSLSMKVMRKNIFSNLLSNSDVFQVSRLGGGERSDGIDADSWVVLQLLLYHGHLSVVMLQQDYL